MLTKEEIDAFTRRVDSLLVSASSILEMYRKLNLLDRNGRGGWQLLRNPTRVGGVLVAVLLRPDPDVK